MPKAIGWATARQALVTVALTGRTPVEVAETADPAKDAQSRAAPMLGMNLGIALPIGFDRRVVRVALRTA